MPAFAWTLPSAAFSSDDLDLYSFTVIKHELLNPVSFLVNHRAPGVVWGLLTQLAKQTLTDPLLPDGAYF